MIKIKIAWVLPRVSAKWRRRARRQPGEWRRHKAPGTMWPGSPETSPRKSRIRQTYEKRRDDILYRKTVSTVGSLNTRDAKLYRAS